MMVKTMDLPRQAQDKHAETLTKDAVSAGTAALRSWYDEKGVGSRHLWSDTCGEGVVGIPCNKGCPLPIAK